jgi:3-keto-5-aminohexanoate cleavage enzyme
MLHRRATDQEPEEPVMAALLTLNLCPTGMVPTRAMSPHVPLGPQEIVEDILACAEIGLTSVHIHARDEDGAPTHRREVFAEIIAGVREVRSDVLLGVTTSGRLDPSLEPRAEVLTLSGDLRPDMASLTTSSLNFARSASVSAPDVVRGLAERMRDAGIKPELEIFDLGMARYAGYLVERGVLLEPLYANLFVGNVATAHAELSDMAAMVSAMPPGTMIGFGGIGRAQRPAAAVAVAMGYGVRIGLEDNLYADDDRRELATNPDLVRLVHLFAAQHERQVMSGDTLRGILGIVPAGT